MKVRDSFSESDLERVRAATQSAEQTTAGEIVCVIAERSDSYDEAAWKAATLGALTGVVVAAIAWTGHLGWGNAWRWWIGAVPVGATLGYLLAIWVWPLRRSLAGEALLDLRVRRRAYEAFVREEVFATRERTGVLLYLSLAEHRVQLLCDEGIRGRVPASAWTEIVDRLTAGLRSGNHGAALVKAVESCGTLLREHGVERSDDDINELADQPRWLDD